MENHSYKHKEEHKKREKHRDHKKRKERKEREMSAKHKDSSGKKRRHGSKDKHKHRERKRDDKENLFNKEVKYELEELLTLTLPKHHKKRKEREMSVKHKDSSGKERRDEDKIKHRDGSKDKHKHREKRGDKEKRKEREMSAKHKDSSGKKRRDEDEIKHRHGSKDKHKHSEKKRDDKEKLFDSKEVPKHEHTLKRKANDDNSSDSMFKKIKTEREEKIGKGKQSDCDKVVKSKKAKKQEGEEFDGKNKVMKMPEKKYTDGTKWRFLEHKGPVFDPEYEPLPNDVKFYYNGKHMKLSPGAEEVATFFAQMLDHECATKDIFLENFFKDWRKEMTEEERAIIEDLAKCNFREVSDYFEAQSKARRAMSTEEKQKTKDENERLLQEYGFCIMDKKKERITNFRTEPPGLFRGIKGDHPKMGMLKRRVKPEDCIINCSEDSEWPKPPPGKKWKDVRHDNKVNWLASWADNIKGSMKYIAVNPSSRVNGVKELEKFETARKLKKCVDRIRAQYHDDWKSKEMMVRQRAVALYLIDKLALRAGNEKDEGETAHAVGCCSLRVEHITLHQEKDGEPYVVEFDFPGKGGIRHPVEKRVFKNLHRFMESKQPRDHLFDRVTTDILNKHLQELMDGLTAKVFRTYNASVALQQQLKELTEPRGNVTAKVLSYNRAVAKTFEASAQNLQAKVDAKGEQLSIQPSMLNYLDPRISVAWCKSFNVPIEKIYNNSQRDKFACFTDKADKDFEF